MIRKLFPLLSLLMIVSIALAACGAPPPSGDGEPVTVKETVIVTVEVPGEAPTAVPPPAAGGERLQAVLDRGNLICGVHGSFQGFGFVDSAGVWSGFDVEF